MARTGRPTTYKDTVAELICQRIACGETLVAICSDRKMPAYRTVLQWRHKRDDFAQMYARAREDSADFDADEIKQIADDSSLNPQDRRVKIDARKWLAGKKNAKHYGDKVTNEHTGPDGGPIVLWGAKSE